MNAFKRHPNFTKAPIVNPIIDEFLRTTAECGVEGIAYCFMPDHAHALLAGASESADLKESVARFRQRAGKDFRQWQLGRLWQEGYFDRSLRSTDATIDVVAYILNNPVRAGLCKSPSEYPFSGSSRYTFEELLDAVQWKPDWID